MGRSLAHAGPTYERISLMEKTPNGANVRFPPPLIYVIGLALGLAAGRFLHVPDLGLPIETREFLGAALAVAGIFVSFAGAGLFLRHDTAIIPFKPATSLVTSGVYRWTRNPMYLGMALIYLGIAVFLNSLPALVLLAPVIWIVHTQVIAREEAYLERAFGNEYIVYKNQVRPWI